MRRIVIFTIAAIMSAIIISNVAFAGVTPFVSLSAVNKTENNMNNPMGSIGFKYVNESMGNVYLKFEHISSIPKKDYGINMVGVGCNKELIDGLNGYLSVNYHNKLIDDNNDYAGKINDVFIVAGVKYNWYYLEVLENKVMSGVRIELK